MNHNARLTELLLDWQEQYDRGRDVPSAVLCEQCPELAAEVERQIAIRRKAGRSAREVADRSGCGTDTRSTNSAGSTNADPEGGPTWQQGAAAGEDEPTAWLRSVAPPQGPGELARLGQFAVRRPLGAGGMG